MSDARKPTGTTSSTPRAPKASPAPVMPEPKASPVFGIALTIGLIGFILMVRELPFDGEPGLKGRVGITVVSLFVGLMIYSGAKTMIESLLKAIVEVIAVLVFLFDATVAAMVHLWRDSLTTLAMDLGSKEEHAFAHVVIILGVLLFIGNALVFLILHPFSRIVGTSVEIK